MSYRFQHGEPVPEAVRRIVTGQIDKAAGQLTDTARVTDTHIHEARKCFKKIRAVLRLVRSELGAVYKEENALFRDAGRSLSQARDAGVVVATFDQLAPQLSGQSTAKALQSLRRALERRRKKQTGHRSDLNNSVHDVARRLSEARERPASWPLHDDSFDALSTGLYTAYSRGRRALKVVHEEPTPDNVHELRKRVKDLWYHFRLLQPLWPPVMKVSASVLGSLSDELGEHHDLAVFRQVMLSDELADHADSAVRLADLAIHRQEYLLRSALGVCDRFYAEKPKHFLRRIHRYWHVWRQETVEPG